MQTAAEGQWMDGPLRAVLPRDAQDGASAKEEKACHHVAFPWPTGHLPGARRWAAGFTLEASKQSCAGNTALILTWE